MSYSSDIKAELISAKVKNACCRKNVLRAMLLSLPSSPNIRNTDVKNYLSALISEFYPEHELDGELPERSSLGTLTDVSHFKCVGCKGALLRGVFLAAGSVNDPDAHEYNLDFSFKESGSFEEAEKLFLMCGFEFKKRERRSSRILYIKASETIGEFFAAAGNNRVMFDIVNARMTSDIKGALNRENNTDISNISKSTAASEKACEAVRYLINTDRLGMLDETLYKTAMLRLDNPELSLFQLASASPEGVSKSTLNARLKRIIDMADEYRSRDNDK